MSKFGDTASVTRFRRRCRPSSATARRTTGWRRLPSRARPRRGAGQGRGGRHLRQRPEVLPRRREVLGRREPPGLGRDRGHPRPRVRRHGRPARRRGGRSAGASRSATGSSPSRSCPCWKCRYCLRRQVPHVRSARHVRLQARAPRARWRSYMVYSKDALVHKVSRRPAAGPRRLRRAAVLRPARGGASRHHVRRRGGGGRLRSDRARHDRRGQGQEPGSGRSPSTWRRTSWSSRWSAAPT